MEGNLHLHPFSLHKHAHAVRPTHCAVLFFLIIIFPGLKRRHFQMETSMLEASKACFLMEGEHIHGQMELSMKVTGKEGK